MPHAAFRFWGMKSTRPGLLLLLSRLGVFIAVKIIAATALAAQLAPLAHPFSLFIRVGGTDRLDIGHGHSKLVPHMHRIASRAAIDLLDTFRLDHPLPG